MGSSRLSVPAGGPGPSFLPARAGERKGRTAWRVAAVSASVAAVMARDTGSAWSARGRVIDVLFHLPNLIRLYWRLFRDPRVSLWPKALLVGALAYVVLPFDLIPDFIPFVGEIDDLVIVIVAARWFMHWCPPEVVREHAQAIA